MKKTLSVVFLMFFQIILFTSTLFSQNINEFERNSENWITEAKAIYRLDCDAKERIWDAYCGLLDAEKSMEYSDISVAQSLAKSYEDQQKSQIPQLISKFNNLKNDYEKLIQVSETKDKATSIFDRVKTEYERLEKLKDQDIWKGTNNPLIQYAVEYGKSMHDQLGRSIGNSAFAYVYDEAFEGRDRPDLVFVSNDGLVIYEFKPENNEAISMGNRQLSTYKSQVVKYYSSYVKYVNGVPTIVSDNNVLGGRKMLEAIVNCKPCWSGESLVISSSSRVYPYKMCDKKYYCVSSR